MVFKLEKTKIQQDGPSARLGSARRPSNTTKLFSSTVLAVTRPVCCFFLH